MNPYDGAIVVVALVLSLFGAIKGLLRIAIGIGSLVAGFLLASWFDGVAGSLFASILKSDAARRLAGFALIFFGVIALGAVAGWLLERLLAAVHLRWMDRMAGAAAGLVATVLMFGALTVPLAAYGPEGNDLLRTSRLAPYVVRVAQAMDAAVPATVRARFRERMAGLERAWETRR